MTEFEASGSVTIRIDNLDSVGDDVAAEVERGFGSVTMQGGGGGGGRGGRGRRRARRVARATQDSRDELSSQTDLLEDILDELGDGAGGGAGGGGGGGGGLLPDAVAGGIGAKALGKAGGVAGALKTAAKAGGKGGGVLAGLSIGAAAGDAAQGPVRDFSQANVDVPDPALNVMEAGATPFAGIFESAQGFNSVLGQTADVAGGGDFTPGDPFDQTKELADRSTLIPDNAIGDALAFRTEGDDSTTASQTGQAGSSSGAGGRIEPSSGGPSLLGSIGPSVGEAAATAAATGQSPTTAAGGGGDSSGTVNVNAPVTVSTPLGEGVERDLSREFERIKREILQTVEQQAPNISEAQFDRFQTRSP
jgi:hypothetical protein